MRPGVTSRTNSNPVNRYNLGKSGYVSQRGRLRLFFLSIAVACIPIAWFYSTLYRYSFNAPFLDDYAEPLGFLDRFTQIHGFVQKLTYFFATQHYESKLLFARTVFLLQYYGSGRIINFQHLMLLGDVGVAGIFGSILWMILPNRSRSEQGLLTVTISLFVFQLQYASALDWAMGSLQAIPVVLFALLTIALICGESRAQFAGSVLTAALTVFSSANGVAVLAIGLVILLQQKRYRRMAGWLVMCCMLAAIYAWRYTPGLSPYPHPSQLPSLGMRILLEVTYLLSFLGSSAARFSSVVPSVCLGACSILVVAVAIRKKYYKARPAIFYAVMFIVTTACGVCVRRAVDAGLSESLASRYRIYSNLVIVLLLVML